MEEVLRLVNSDTDISGEKKKKKALDLPSTHFPCCNDEEERNKSCCKILVMRFLLGAIKNACKKIFCPTSPA